MAGVPTPNHAIMKKETIKIKPIANKAVVEASQSGWSFTGHLLEDLGNNTGVISNNSNLADGIYLVEVHGIETPCIGYFWSESLKSDCVIKRGLVCYINDGDANAFARHQFSLKSAS